MVHGKRPSNLGVEGENTDRDAGDAAHEGEGVANSDLDDAAMLQCDNRSAPATLQPALPKSPRAIVGPPWTRRAGSTRRYQEMPSPTPLANEVAARADQIGPTAVTAS